MRSKRHRDANRFEPEAHLVLADGSERVVALAEGVTSVGRDPRSSVVIDDPTVSATHLMLHRMGGQIKVCDESTYGTRVQGAKLIADQPIKVHDGEAITFGGEEQDRYRLVVHDPLERPPTEPPQHVAKRVRLQEPLRRTAAALVRQYTERVTVAPRAASVEEMADHLEVHPATIRRSLADLEQMLKIDPDLRGAKRLQALAEEILATDAHRS